VTESEGWTGRVFRPLVVGAMVACLALASAGLLALGGVWLSTAALVLIPLLAALESASTRRLIKARLLWRLGAGRTRALEIVLLFIMARLVSYLGYSWADIVAEARLWPVDPLAMAGPVQVAAFGTALLAWWAVNATERDFERIGGLPDSDRRGRSRDYVPPRATVTARIFVGGALLLILTAFPYASLVAGSGFYTISRPLPLYLAAYFVLGLALLALVQHAELQHWWRASGVRVSLGLAGRWARYSLAIVALATLVALVLPTDYSLGLFDLASRALYPLVVAASYVAYGILVAAFFIIALLGRLTALLLGNGPAPMAGPPAEPPVVEPIAPLPNWLDILRSVVFWAATVAGAVYVVRSYLRDHPAVLRSLSRIGWVRGLLDGLARLWGQAARAAAAARELVSHPSLRRRRRGSRARRRLRLLRPGSLPSRERIWYYYGSLLRRAARSGLPRGGSQTPFEYEAAAWPALAGARDDMRLLTQAYVEARYSAHAITPERAQEARAQLSRLMAALRSADVGRKSKGEAATSP